MKTKTKSLQRSRSTDARYAALVKVNLSLHRRIAKLEADLVSARNATTARLENAALDELTDHELQHIIRGGTANRKLKEG